MIMLITMNMNMIMVIIVISNKQMILMQCGWRTSKQDTGSNEAILRLERRQLKEVQEKAEMKTVKQNHEEGGNQRSSNRTVP